MGKKFRIKKKKRIKSKVLLVFLLVLLLFFCIKNKPSINIDVKDKESFNYILGKSFKNKNDYSFLLGKLASLFNRDLDNPSSFTTFYSDKKASNTISIKEEDPKEDNYNTDDYKKITSYIENTNKKSIDNPLVYIYNTHQLETYSKEGIDNLNMTPNIMMASYLISEKLNQKGIATIAEDTNMSEFQEKMGLTSDDLYGASRLFIKHAKEKYPNLKLIIDLHRDAVSKEVATINIDGKNYARILFVLGVTNPNYQENEEVMKKIDSYVNENHYKLSRGIYERPTPTWPDSYNQDLGSNIILIELGAEVNTIDEVLNTVDVLSDAIGKYITENL